VAIVALAATTVSVAVSDSPALAAGINDVPNANRSGLAWPSGVFTNGSAAEYNEAFGDFRGRPLDVVTTWPDRVTWNDIIEPNNVYQAYSGQPYTMVFGIPPIPENDGATMEDCAAGAYDSKWERFGQTMSDLNLGSSVIRLGWEMNGDWFLWGSSQTDPKVPVNPTTFAKCYGEVVTSIRVTAPNLKFDWNINRGSSAGMSGNSVLDAYPGDKYVDFVGIDNYDIWVDWENSDDSQLDGDQGLQYWLNFATAHGKKLSVPEWGLFGEGKNGGHGDNADFIQHMYDFFAANADHIGYEAYFNEYSDYISNSLFAPVQMPAASARYKELYKLPESGTVIEDTQQGSTTGTVQFSANWGQCTTDCANAADNSFRWTGTTGSTATVRFTGRQIKWIGMQDPLAAIATVSIDGGAATDIDPYSSTTSAGTKVIYTSPMLTKGAHTLVITKTNRHNPNTLTGNSITFDRSEVLNSLTVIEDTRQGTSFTGTVQFSARWAQCTTNCASAGDDSFKWTTATGSTATVRFTGRRMNWIGMKEPFSAIATVSIDGTAATDVDPYSPTRSTGVLYTSPTLTQGQHTVVITKTNRRNAKASDGYSITFDRAEILN
jgi:uncharacterized protein YchJ